MGKKKNHQFDKIKRKRKSKKQKAKTGLNKLEANGYSPTGFLTNPSPQPAPFLHPKKEKKSNQTKLHTEREGIDLKEKKIEEKRNLPAV